MFPFFGDCTFQKSRTACASHTLSASATSQSISCCANRASHTWCACGTSHIDSISGHSHMFSAAACLSHLPAIPACSHKALPALSSCSSSSLTSLCVSRLFTFMYLLEIWPSVVIAEVERCLRILSFHMFSLSFAIIALIVSSVFPFLLLMSTFKSCAGNPRTADRFPSRRSCLRKLWLMPWRVAKLSIARLLCHLLRNCVCFCAHACECAFVSAVFTKDILSCLDKCIPHHPLRWVLCSNDQLVIRCVVGVRVKVIDFLLLLAHCFVPMVGTLVSSTSARVRVGLLLQNLSRWACTCSLSGMFSDHTKAFAFTSKSRAWMAPTHSCAAAHATLRSRACNLAFSSLLNFRMPTNLSFKTSGSNLCVPSQHPPWPSRLGCSQSTPPRRSPSRAFQGWCSQSGHKQYRTTEISP